MNKVMLLGRLTREPEIKYTANNLAVCKFGLAVNRRFVKQGEERQADFLNIVAFGKTADFCSKYFTKGQQVIVSGRIQVSTWDDQDGKRQYFTDIVAEEAYFADGKRSDSYEQQPVKDDTKSEFYPVSDEDDELPF